MLDRSINGFATVLSLCFRVCVAEKYADLTNNTEAAHHGYTNQLLVQSCCLARCCDVAVCQYAVNTSRCESVCAVACVVQVVIASC